jgi:hypothetical protein
MASSNQERLGSFQGKKENTFLSLNLWYPVQSLTSKLEKSKPDNLGPTKSSRYLLQVWYY